MLSLEPRLKEYLKIKKYNKIHGITTNKPEKDFNITKFDIETIKNFKLNEKKQNMFKDEITHQITHFPSEKLQSDPRLEKIKKKQQRDKDALYQRQKYDIISKSFDMYRDDRNFASAYGNDFKSRFNPNVWMEDVKTDNFDDVNKEQIEYMKKRSSNTNKSKDNVKPTISYNNYLSYNCDNLNDNYDYSLNSIIQNLDKFNNNVKKYDKSCDLNYYENNSSQMISKNEKYLKDINTENYLCYGDGNTRGQKSLGYPNPVEHYFQFISNDISSPEHTVFEPGMPSRLYNKDIAKPYKKRDIM